MLTADLNVVQRAPVVGAIVVLWPMPAQPSTLSCMMHLCNLLLLFRRPGVSPAAECVYYCMQGVSGEGVLW